MKKAAHEHSSWQIREAPDGSKYCAACGDTIRTPEQIAAQEAAEQAFPENEWTQPAVVAAFREAFLKGVTWHGDDATERARDRIREILAAEQPSPMELVPTAELEALREAALRNATADIQALHQSARDIEDRTTDASYPSSRAAAMPEDFLAEEARMDSFEYRPNVEPTSTLCPEGDGRTHHMLPRAKGMVCRYCKLTEAEIRASLEES